MQTMKAFMLALAFLFVSFKAQSATQVYCMPLATLVQGLTEMGEAPVGAGTIAGKETRIVLFASEEKRTWTLAADDQSGKACVLSFGTGWNASIPITPAESK